MGWRSNVLLAILGIATALFVAQFQRFPGYLDSDYYFGGALQLADGKGFSEPYLWNYLDDPKGLPHPSHAYWMPLASILASAGMFLTGHSDYASGRLGFIALAGAAPVVTAALAYAISRRRELAIISGLLAVFSAYYVPFMSVPDNYGVYMVLGALFLLLLERPRMTSFLSLGLVAGMMSLARSDGILWLVLAWLAALLLPLRPHKMDHQTGPSDSLRQSADRASRMGMAAAGFLIVMLPWYLRNYAVHGTVMAPGGGHLLWLTAYDETFIYPAAQLTLSRWLETGIAAITSARLAALRWNLLNAFAAQGEIFLLAFILIGAWRLRDDPRVRVGGMGWLALLLTMTLIFPYAGSRGGFFHAGAGFQSLWWALAPIGLDSVVAAARKRGLFTPQAPVIFRWALVALAVVLSAAIVRIRVLPGWGEGEQYYPTIDDFLHRSGARAGEVAMVRNPPGYYVMTGRAAIVVPYADAQSILAAARRYDARYLIIETAGAAGPIKSVYDDLGSQVFVYLGEVDGTRIFRVEP